MTNKTYKPKKIEAGRYEYRGTIIRRNPNVAAGWYGAWTFMDSGADSLKDACQQIENRIVRSVVERAKNLCRDYNALSPENFWQDGEKPRTQANKKAYDNLFRQYNRDTNIMIDTLATLTDEQFEQVKEGLTLYEREVIVPLGYVQEGVK
jgi:hypothetical protein